MTDNADLIARAERAIQNARDFTDDKKPSLQITMELLAAVKASEEQQLRALAPIDGLALVRELRAESETRHQLHLEQVRITNEWIADRDRLVAANSKLEAKVTGLRAAFRVNMLRFGPPGTSHEEIDAAIDAALATQEAGT